MGLLTPDQPYSRSAHLGVAGKLRAKGKHKKAIAEYQKILAVDPNDHEVRGRVAPILAETGDLDAAWDEFCAAAEGWASKGFHERALSLYKQTLEHLPRAARAWHRVAELNLELKRPRDAVAALLQGRRGLRRKGELEPALRLLVHALEIEPKHLGATLDAALLQKRLGARDEGLALVRRLVPHLERRDRRRARARLFRLRKTPASLWRWLRNTPA